MAVHAAGVVAGGEGSRSLVLHHEGGCVCTVAYVRQVVM